MIQLRASTTACAALLVFCLLSGCRDQSVTTYQTAKEPSTSATPETPAAMPGTAGGELPPGHPPIGGDMPALPPGHPAIGSMPGDMAPAGPSPDNSLTWAAPDNWAAKPLGAMRRGSFTVKRQGGDADCSIFVFPAASNPLLANINRWRGQVGLAPLTDAQLPAETASIENAGMKFTVVDLLGKQPGTENSLRLLGAILYRGEEAWFFKLGGPDAVVAAEKDAFLNFLRTVRPAAP